MQWLGIWAKPEPHKVGACILYMSAEQKAALEKPHEVPEVRI